VQVFISDIKSLACDLHWKNMEEQQELRKVPMLSDYQLDGWVSREEAMRELDRQIAYIRESKFSSPKLAIVSCCRGGGKSKFFNHVAESKVAEEFFPIAVTFSSFSPASSEEELDVYWALTKRILFS